MQLRSLLVPLLALVPIACRSNGNQSEAGRDDVRSTAESGTTEPSAAAEAPVVAAADAPQPPSPSEPAAQQPTQPEPTQPEPMQAAPAQAEPAQNTAPVETSAPRQENKPPTPAQDQAPGSLQEDVERARVRQQQGAFLASEYLKKGDALLERADLVGALEAYSSALNLDPTNQSAREKLHKVEGLMGTSYADAAGLLKDATEQEMVRRAQARLAAEDASLKGDNALRAGDVNTAIEQYRQA